MPDMSLHDIAILIFVLAWVIICVATLRFYQEVRETEFDEAMQQVPDLINPNQK